MIKKFDLPDIDLVACPMLLAAPSDVRKSEYKEDGIPVDVKLPVKHLITRELQVDTLFNILFFKRNSIFFFINFND